MVDIKSAMLGFVIGLLLPIADVLAACYFDRKYNSDSSKE